MPSPTAALLWEIWRRHRPTIGVIAGLTLAGRLIVTPPVPSLCGMLAFLLLFAVFNYTASGDARGLGRFPFRLFTLPVTSLRLVTIPVLAGIGSIELLYLLWREPLSRGASTSPLFVGVLLAAFMVLYLAVLWTCDRARSLRLVMIGAAAFAFFGIGLLPSFPPSPPGPWRSEPVLGSLVIALAAASFLLAWRHVTQSRSGGGRRYVQLESLIRWRDWTLTPRQPFLTPAAAHFWFEWRSSGMVLPSLVAGVLLVVIMPMSWIVRSDAGNSFRLLVATLAAPVVLAVPAGVAFSKPRFWSEELSFPSFTATLPVSSEDFVATKVRVAAVSALLSWAIVLPFVMTWLLLWANLDAVSQLAIQIWAFHEFSVAAVYGVAVLVALAGVVLTWRFLVSRLWSGLSGRRSLFVGSVVCSVAFVIAGLVFDADRFPGWILRDPIRLGPVAWIAGTAVVLKFWLAAYAWRDVAGRYVRMYLMSWLVATASLLGLGMVVWEIVRIYVPLDVERLRSVVILVALLGVPLARVGFAPSWVARNRHR